MVSRQNKRKIKSFLVTAFIVVAGVLTVRWIMGNRDESNKPQFDFDEDDIMMVALKARQDKLKSSPPIVANPIFAEIPEPVDDADVQKANEILEAAEGRQQAKKDDASRKLTEVDKKEESLKKILKMIESNEDSVSKISEQIDDMLKKLIGNEEAINELDNMLKARLNILNDKQTEILKQTNAITKKHEVPFFKLTKFSSPPISTINCFGNSTVDRVCKVKNLCYDPTSDKFIVFKDTSSFEVNTPRNRSYLVDMTSIDGHNRFYFDYHEVHPDRYEQRTFRLVEKLTFIISRFHVYNIMHTVHDDFIGLYLLHRLFAPNTDPDPSFTFSQDNNIFFADSFPNLRYDYIFQLLTSNPIQFREVYRTDPNDTMPICFRDAVIGNSKIGSWYTYGFLEPQGPIANKTVSGLLIREIASYIIKRFHLPIWNENSIRGILRELKEIIESRKGKKREALFRSISDHHFITVFSRKIDRLITNEGELAERLERIYGLEVRYVRIEDMHLREQITILKNTVIAIGMHGSALILSMFLPPGALLVELYPYRVPAENYTPYKTLCHLPGMRLAYKAWVNTHPENNYPHPEKPAAGGGIRHLPKEKQEEIESGTTVPPHLCCADPTWLFRIYQDTKADIDEIFDLIDEGISEGYDLVNSDPGEYVYIRPASVENVYCRVANSTELENHLDLYISWTAPWNGVKPDYYGLWMHQAYKEFVSNSTDYVFESCIPGMEYDIWVRPYTVDRLSGESYKGGYSDKFTCKCSLDAKAIKKKVEEEQMPFKSKGTRNQGLMRFLDLSELAQLNTTLSDLPSNDGSVITGRAECYSCKAAGNDKKLLQQLIKKYPDGLTDDLTNDFASESMSLPNSFFASSPVKGQLHLENSTPETQSIMPLKAFYFLVSTMNLMFPDYDFSYLDVNPDTFQKHASLPAVVNQINTTLFNTGANKSFDLFTEFSRKMWDIFDQAIDMHESDIYSFMPSSSYVDDPFNEKGVMYMIPHAFSNLLIC